MLIKSVRCASVLCICVQRASDPSESSIMDEEMSRKAQSRDPLAEYVYNPAAALGDTHHSPITVPACIMRRWCSRRRVFGCALDRAVPGEKRPWHSAQVRTAVSIQSMHPIAWEWHAFRSFCFLLWLYWRCDISSRRAAPLMGTCRAAKQSEKHTCCAFNSMQRLKRFGCFSFNQFGT